MIEPIEAKATGGLMGSVPVFGVCGGHGASRRRLATELTQRLAAAGLRAAVIRGDVFRSGGGAAKVPLQAPSGHAGPCCDLFLMEERGAMPGIPKAWLAADRSDEPPCGFQDVRCVLRPGTNHAGAIMQVLLPWLREEWSRTPLRAGVLMGGGSRRMGRPKHLITLPDGRTWIERIVAVLAEATEERPVLLGNGEVPAALRSAPRLDDVEDRPGPLGGMLSAMRSAPASGWIFCACDQPLISVEAIRWLLSFRRPGVWAVLPRLGEGPDVEPMLGYYDHRARWLLEDADVPRRAAQSDRAHCPIVPEEHAAGWKNINTPVELAVLDERVSADPCRPDAAPPHADRRT